MKVGWQAEPPVHLVFRIMMVVGEIAAVRSTLFF
jgi:hypothetical protein